MRPILAMSVLAGCVAGSKHAYLAAPSPERLAVATAERTSGEEYKDWGRNQWTDASKDHLSTFAADVDTASYTIARRKLLEGALPPAASVRVEEWVNYFKYELPPPKSSVFQVAMDAAPHPFEPDRYVLRIGVGTKAKPAFERKPANLVFLVDVSGSMDSADKLGLAKQSLQILTENLSDRDTVALVTYAGDSRVILPRTGADQKARILSAIDQLHSGGGTAMASGMDTAYELAAQNLKPGTISRVIVLTDGDANIGPHSMSEILDIIGQRAKAGVALSTIGFGMGNYRDALMEQLADKGNGNNYYIDSLDAAKRVFADQLTSTIETAAKDVKLQVDFDPAVVSQYRLIGYENRDIADKDFRNDRVDAGQVGWGHQVTALYEVKLASDHPAPLGLVRVRHKAPEGDVAVEETFAMAAAPAPSMSDASPDLRFAFAVAAFADTLRGGTDASHWSLDEIRRLAASVPLDNDRTELLSLIDRAKQLRGEASTAIAR
jgi:Ca-activated chloride channel family protein